jgi:hypothetical protein
MIWTIVDIHLSSSLIIKKSICMRISTIHQVYACLGDLGHGLGDNLGIALITAPQGLRVCFLVAYRLLVMLCRKTEWSRWWDMSTDPDTRVVRKNSNSRGWILMDSTSDDCWLTADDFLMPLYSIYDDTWWHLMPFGDICWLLMPFAWLLMHFQITSKAF